MPPYTIDRGERACCISDRFQLRLRGAGLNRDNMALQRFMSRYVYPLACEHIRRAKECGVTASLGI